MARYFGDTPPLTGNRSAAAHLTAMLLVIGACAAFASAASAAPSYFLGSGEMQPGVYGAASALLPGGDVLIAGGEYESAPSDGAETFDPTTKAFTALDSTLQTARGYPVAAALPDGDVLIAGGLGTGSLNSAELFDPSSDTFTTLAATMPYGFYAGVAAPLPNGDVLIAGGSSGGSALDQAMIYDPTSETFSELGSSMTTPRSGAFAAALPNGEVLIGGGMDGTSTLSSAELYDPTSQTFTALAATTTVPRYGSVAAQLPDGNVLIAGGDDGNATTANDSSELFNPSTGTFTALTATLPANTANATATALPNGEVLVAGGQNGFGTVNSGLLFLPQPEASISVADFGTENVAQSSGEQTLTVTNLGFQSLAITGATILGNGFGINQDECVGVSLTFERSCTMLLTFTPTGGGPQSATLTLTDNEIIPASVTLSGTGISPPVTVASATEPSAPTAFSMSLTKHSASHHRVTLHYTLTAAAAVKLTVLSAHGRTVTVLRTDAAAGTRTVTWNGRIKGKLAKAGPYRLKLTAIAGGVTVTRSTSIRL